MKNQAAHDRLQPSLLDRLVDDEPGNLKETRDEQVITLSRLKELVVRDLGWLMNCNNYEHVRNLDDYPEVKRSVVNYGVPDFAGASLSATDLAEMERSITEAIIAFEPRIIPSTLSVSANLGNSIAYSRKTVTLEIGGRIWATPYSLEFLLQSELDLDTGAVVLLENNS